MGVLVHVCCAGCYIGVLRALREEGVDGEGYFVNPNIHPFREFRKRMRALEVYLECDAAPTEFVRGYGLREFVEEIYRPVRGERCAACYEARLRKTAVRALARGFEGFTTTLLVSPHQEHEVVRAVGERVGAEVGVGFLYRDFRGFFAWGQAEAKRRHLYRQQYCGCCFSEYERYGSEE